MSNSIKQDKLNMADFDAVLFDFDGVIADSEPLHIRTKTATLEAFSIPYSQKQISSFQGSPEADFFDFFAQSTSYSSSELLAYKRRLFEQDIHQIEPIEGAMGFVKQISQLKPCYLVTSSIRTQMTCFMERHQMFAFFSGYVCCEDVSRHKPHPAPYLTCMEKNNLNSSRCLVIEDSPNGVKSAQSAGCYVVGLAGEFSSQALLENGANIVVKSYTMLEERLASY